MSAIVYGIDSSSSGHVAWCDSCGWRSDLEPFKDDATDHLIRHRIAEHLEPRGRIEGRLGVTS